MGILRGPRRSDGSRVEIHDREPRLDSGKQLFELAPSKWVGSCLVFGTAETSPVIEVRDETDTGIVTQVTAAALALVNPPAPKSQHTAPPKRPPYPANYVDDVEYAAQILRIAYQKKTLFEDLRGKPELLEQMRVALTECALMVQAMGKKLGD